MASDITLLLLALMTASGLSGQTATLSGRVSDESGAVNKGSEGDAERAAKTGADRGIRWGRKLHVHGIDTWKLLGYGLGPQLVMPAAIPVTLNVPGETVNLQLQIAATAAQVTVQENAGPPVGTEASLNANATIVTGADLQSLSDAPDDLQADLEALAGPTAGPGGN